MMLVVVMMMLVVVMMMLVVIMMMFVMFPVFGMSTMFVIFSMFASVTMSAFLMPLMMPRRLVLIVSGGTLCAVWIYAVFVHKGNIS